MTPAHPAFIHTGDGVRIAYRLEGPEDRPVLLLSNSIGTDMHMWDGQMPALTKHFRVLRYDARGHGASGVPAGPYALDRLGRDAVELLDALALARVHVLGLSLGGLVAQWLGIHVPERVDRLVLSNTAAWLGPAAPWDRAIAELLQLVPGAHAGRGRRRRRVLPPHAARDAPRRHRRQLGRRPRRRPAPHGCAHPPADAGHRGRRRHRHVRAPRRGGGGRDPGAQLRVLPAMHLSNVEQPAAFLDAVVGFLQQAQAPRRRP